MSHSISTLLTRNLHDVFGENDPARRRTAIYEIFTEDCVFYDPSKGVYRGRDEIDRVAGAIRATHPDFRYQPIAQPEELGNAGRIQWVSGRPGEAPAYAGPDFIVARDGRIAAIYLFFDKYAERSLQQHHESLGTTSAIRRSICSASSKTGLSRMSSAPPSATSRSPRTQASGGP